MLTRWPQIASVFLFLLGFAARAQSLGQLTPSHLASVSQSTDATTSNVASMAVDGNPSSLSLTLDRPGSYWTAVFERPYPIDHVEIVNRVAPNDKELAGLTLRLYGIDDQILYQTVLTNPGSGGTLTVTPTNRVRARSIWIGLDGSDKNGGGHFRVGLPEVRVYGELAIPYVPPLAPPSTNTIRPKVYQSSDYSASYPAANAIDGNDGSFSHTLNFTNSYWMADLGTAYPIDRVEIVNRQDCCSARLGGVIARIYDASSNSIPTAVGTIQDPGLGGTWTLTPAPGTVGRYLRVGLENGQKNSDGNYYITLAEVRIWSGTTNLLMPGAVSVAVTNNLASFKTSYMVRLTPDLPPASAANDNNYSTQSITTTATVDGYWEVDLGATYALYGMRTIAASGIGSRLTNTTARLYDEGHSSVFSRMLTGTPDVFDTDLDGPIFARYVRVGLEDKQRTDPNGGYEWYIGMREVEVFGRPTNEVGILGFSASSTNVDVGEPVTLSWNVEGVERLEIHPAMGSVGAYTDSSGSGRAAVAPTNSTEYILIATNAAGVFSRAVGVEIRSNTLPVRISEIVADNKYSLQDGYGDAPDWIELRNTGNRPFSLTGCGLSDDPLKPMKWIFPATNIPPHSTLIVFASGDKIGVDPAGFLHTTFHLSKGGGAVVLTAPDGVSTIDILPAYPALDTDLAYGRDLDGSWTFLDPTPGAVNAATSYLGWLNPVTFSQERGIYSNAFTLNITNNSPGATVYYSLDGSVPSIPYTSGLAIGATRAVRAQVRRPGYRPPRTQHETYIFLDDVIGSSVMNKTITKDTRYAPRLKPGLLSLPSISLILPGQPEYTGKEGSIEIIWPDGTPSSQVNCDIERFGSSYESFAKRSIRIVCKSKYGSTRIKAPLFNGFDHGVTPVTSFNELEVRSGSQDMVERGFYMAGPFVQDTMMDMGNLNPHDRFVHVYINGVYWGQYDAREPLVDHMMADYLGGSPDDYVAVKGNDNVGDNFVVGTPEAPIIQPWTNVLARMSSYEAVKPFVDVKSLTDFMLMWYYGNCESEFRTCGPVAAGTGFKFWEADADGFLQTSALGLDRSDNVGPAGIFGALVAQGDPDFKMLVADRIYADFFNDGALTPSRADARLAARMQECSDSLILECARWGYRTPANWVSAAATIRSQLFPARTGQMIPQLRARGLYPSVNPPVFNQYGGAVTNGFQPQLTATGGKIYYTLDGSDPRQSGGAVSTNALVWSAGAVSISGDTTLLARVRTTAGAWSALERLHFTLLRNPPPSWTSQPDVQFPVGIPLEIPLSVSDPTAPAGSLSFQSSGLPPGFSLDTNALRISGTGKGTGLYLVTVIASDNQVPPAAASLLFNLQLTPAFTAAASLQPGGSLQLAFPSIAGQDYRIEYTDNLTSTNWALLQEIPSAATNTVSLSAPVDSAAAERYYRVRWMR